MDDRMNHCVAGNLQGVSGVCHGLSKVIDQLCKVAQENSVGKCMSCMLPTENLILSVLHVLSDAGQIGNVAKENIDPNVTTKHSDHRLDADGNVLHKYSSLKASTSSSKRVLQCNNQVAEPAAASNIIKSLNAQIPKSNVVVAKRLKENMRPEILGSGNGTSFGKGSYLSSSCIDYPKYCTQLPGRGSGRAALDSSTSTGFLNRQYVGPEKNNSSHVSATISSRPKELFAYRESSKLFIGTEARTPLFVLDTPVVMHQGNRRIHESPSIAGNGSLVSKKGRVESHMRKSVKGSHADGVVDDIVEDFVGQQKSVGDVEYLGSRSFRDSQLLLGSLSADLYNRRNFIKKRSPAIKNVAADTEEVAEERGPANVVLNQNVETERFPVTEVEKGLYNIICGLANSQWRTTRAVQFSLTSLTFQSLGESVEAGGLADNFFMSAMCRKYFEDVHPRQSKKHYFYPKVGGCLYTYESTYDVHTVKKSFLGANSAYKLHLSDKLCFPVVLGKHWFVFIVDMKNNLFVFLDSFYGCNDNFQIDARTKLISAFKDCWYEYAEVKKDVDVFSVFYPPVPKQQNTVDCGIFCVKFMELWDQSIDLRCMFDQSDIPNLRVKIALELFFCRENCIDKSTVLNMYEEGIDPRGIF